MELTEQIDETGEHPTPFTGDAMERLAEEGPILDRVEQVQQELEEDLADRTKTGRKSKKARTAEEIQQFQQVTRTAAAGLNALLSSRVPELEYTSEELDVIGTLGGKILSKHVDSAMTEYGDEITLAVFMLSSASEKAMRYQSRVKEEGGTTWMSSIRQKINKTITNNAKTGNRSNTGESGRRTGTDATPGTPGGSDPVEDREGDPG